MNLTLLASSFMDVPFNTVSIAHIVDAGSRTCCVIAVTVWHRVSASLTVW
jgi:hypothetical protein